jgi:hypothetical protein
MIIVCSAIFIIVLLIRTLVCSWNDIGFRHHVKVSVSSNPFV